MAFRCNLFQYAIRCEAVGRQYAAILFCRKEFIGRKNVCMTIVGQVLRMKHHAVTLRAFHMPLDMDLLLLSVVMSLIGIELQLIAIF